VNESTKISLVFGWAFFCHFQRNSVDGSARSYFALQKSLVRPNFIHRDFLLYAGFSFVFTFSDHFNQRKGNPSIPSAGGICCASCWTYQQGVNMSDTGFKVSAGDRFPLSLEGPGPPGRRAAWASAHCRYARRLSWGNPEAEERGAQPLSDTLQAASVKIKLSRLLHKHMLFSQRIVLRGLDIAEVSLTPGSCVGCSLCFH